MVDTRLRAIGLLALLALAASACGGSQSAQSPTGPSAASVSSATGTGTNGGSLGDAGSGSGTPDGQGIAGTVGDLKGTCPTIAFTLGGKTVRTTARTTFGPGTCADVKNGKRAAARGLVQPDGTLLAKDVRVGGPADGPGPGQPGNPPPGGPPGVAGTVSALGGSCPTLTFVLDGRTVKTTDKTRFGPGTCADVKNGARAAAKGLPQGDGTLLASHVKVGAPQTP